MSDFTATPSHPATTPASSNEPIHHHNAEEEKDGDPLQLHGHGHEPSSDTHSQQPTTTTTTSNNTNDDAHSSFNLVGENTWDTFEDYDDDDEEEEKEEDEGKPHSTATNNSPFGSQEEPIVFVQGSPLSTGQQQQRARRTSIHQPVSLKVTAPKVTERRHYDTGITHCCFGWSRGPCLDGFFCRQCALGYQSHLVTDLATPEERRYDYNPEATNEHLSMRAAVCAPALALDVLLLGFGTALCNIPHRLRINETYNIGESRCWSVFASCCCTSCAVIQQQKFLSNRGHFPGGVCADPPPQKRIDHINAYTTKKTRRTHRMSINGACSTASMNASATNGEGSFSTFQTQQQTRPHTVNNSNKSSTDAATINFATSTVFFPTLCIQEPHSSATTQQPQTNSNSESTTSSATPSEPSAVTPTPKALRGGTEEKQHGGGEEEHPTHHYTASGRLDVLATSLIHVSDLRGGSCGSRSMIGNPAAALQGPDALRCETGFFDPLAGSIYLDIKPLDLIFFRSEGAPTVLSRVVSHIGTTRQSTAFPHLTAGDFSHIGVVLTSDVLDHPAMLPGVPYVLEATSTSSAETLDISGESFTGVQLRNLEAICNERKESDTMSIALCSLREDVKEEKLYHYSDEEIKALINAFFQKYHKAEYNFNPVAIASLAGIKAARAVSAEGSPSGKERKDSTTTTPREQGKNKKFVCSSLVATLYKDLGIFPSTLKEDVVLPMDFLGFDEDGQVPVVVDTPAMLLGTQQ